MTTPTSQARFFPYLTAAGSVVFGLVHLYWLVGGGLGLPDGRSLYDSPMIQGSGSPAALIVIDAIAVPISALAAVLAVGLANQGPAARLARHTRLRIAAAISATCFIHSAPVVLEWFRISFAGSTTDHLSQKMQFSVFVYEPVFFLGGVLFALAALSAVVYRRELRADARVTVTVPS